MKPAECDEFKPYFEESWQLGFKDGYEKGVAAFHEAVKIEREKCALADARSDVLRMHAEIERLKQVRCEGCGYLVSEREHLGCKSEKTLKDLERLTTERDNAEKREYEVLGRANALEAELKATQARLVASDELLREEFAQRQDALATLRDISDFAHDRSTGPAVEDALWEVRRMANAEITGATLAASPVERRVSARPTTKKGNEKWPT